MESIPCESDEESQDSSIKTTVFYAMFDYTANEEDELNFTEGDIVEECQFVGEGWLYGKNRRTGAFGMLPANYVESANCWLEAYQMLQSCDFCRKAILRQQID